MEETEAQIDAMESQVPELAAKAVEQAYQRALASGRGVMVRQDGAIYEVFGDGTRRFVKAIAPPTAVVPGTRIEIR